MGPLAKLLRFRVGAQRFALPLGAIKETLPERPLTRLPLVPPAIAGLINLRGEVVAVLDLGALLGLPAAASARDEARGRSVVVLRGSGTRGADKAAAGLLVDQLDGVRDFDAAELRPPPPTLLAEPAGYLDGVLADSNSDNDSNSNSDDGAAPAPLLVLAAQRLLDSERLRPFRRETR